MTTPAWKDWYHCYVGTYGQRLPGDPRGWRERNRHEEIPKPMNWSSQFTKFAKARHDHSRRIMNFEPYEFAQADRPIVGKLLLSFLQSKEVKALSLALGATHFHALLQLPNHKPKQLLGMVKRHITFEFAPIIDPATNQRRQIWEANGRAKPLRDRAHGISVFKYILNHANQGAWVWSYKNQLPDPLP
ncbi:MAG TPA: hypothetical protein VGN88_06595 [Phycisphaerae bacterium]